MLSLLYNNLINYIIIYIYSIFPINVWQMKIDAFVNCFGSTDSIFLTVYRNTEC